MSQKQAKGRKKEGKGGDDNAKFVGNAWEGLQKCGWSVVMMNVYWRV